MTTKYIDAAVAQLRAEGHEISDEDVTRLSPLKFKNLNVLGRYSFTPSTPREGLRPLRDPDALELDEDDDGSGDEWTPPEAGSAPVLSHGGGQHRGRRLNHPSRIAHRSWESLYSSAKIPPASRSASNVSDSATRP